MTKKQYMELTWENPEDMFGPDWKNIIWNNSTKYL